MASLSKKLVNNIPGDFYVDSTCINCETCRWIAPKTFDEMSNASRVYHQPQTAEEKKRTLMAMISCPTASIGKVSKEPMMETLNAYPELIQDGVYHCGFHHKASFGAASYLVVRPQGNILIDSPRFAAPLVKNIEKLGGVKYLFLTHKDDIADHKKFRHHFGCERILHVDDVTSATQDVEIKIQGDKAITFDNEVLFIPVPGHTKGSMCFLYQGRFLFTGDHVAWDNESGKLYAFRTACWYDWSSLKASMQNLAHYSFEWLLPGHGWRYHDTVDAMRRKMAICLGRM